MRVAGANAGVPRCRSRPGTEDRRDGGDHAGANRFFMASMLCEPIMDAMAHREQIDAVLAEVEPWPVEDRLALANAILRDAAEQPSHPRQTWRRAMGIAAGAGSPPDDATVDRWMDERRASREL